RDAAEALAALQTPAEASDASARDGLRAPRVAVPVGHARYVTAGSGVIAEREEVDLRAAVGLRDPPPEPPFERLRRWLAG
ncbi:MAG: hypothetical protein M3295_02245, partial [Chloroflexota bacterium]|nr:hypothetical protein [Chloroflexota bacterium]